jgi:hypothetical protein
MFADCWRNAREAARVFSDRFPDRPSPDHKTILRGLKKQGKFCRIGMKLAEVHEPHGPWLMNRQY